MAPLTRRLVLAEELFQRIQHLKKGVGLIYGFASDEVLEAFGVALCNTESVEKRLIADDGLEGEILECLSHIQTSLPAGIRLIGHVLAQTKEFNAAKILENSASVFTEEGLYDGKEPLFLEICDGEIRARVGNETIPHETLPMTQILRSYVTVRLRGQLSLSVEGVAEVVTEDFAVLRQRATCGVYTFFLEKPGVYLRDEHEMTGVSAEQLVKQLIETKKKRKTDEMEVLESSLLAKPVKFTAPGEADPLSNCAPVVQHRKREHECVVIPLRIDALSVVPRDASLSDLYRTLVESLRRQLAAAEQCVLTELHHTRRISPPEPHHFQPAPLAHALTLVLPRDVPDADLAGLRERRHDVFLLTKDRPLFRRGCSYVFPSDVTSNAPLFNPHEGLQPPALRNAETSLVRGRYRYFHYLQDGIDDNGWGCAYRSLQTLASWFRLQGYTEVPVPSHRDIQQCLVNIGDKPANFIGSRQWIGSTEVSFCLETLLGVSSRILSVSSGPELCTRADELLRHFDTHGTPIMVGGGVLAHTILGVSLERDSGEVRFLILDPHYIGPEELPTVLAKAGCVWKGPDFWMKSAFYNLCMPQRPHAIF